MRDDAVKSDLQLGAFARMWSSKDPEQIAAAMADVGLTQAQWNFSAMGLPTVSKALRAEDASGVRRAFDAAGVAVWGLSCTYNIIDPNLERRQAMTEAAENVIGLAPLVGASAVTICTGSADPDNMWAWHPETATDENWASAVTTISRLLEAAARADVLIAVEPEKGNVVSSAVRAVRLLGEVGADAPLGFVVDSANLVGLDELDRQEDIITEAFELLGPKVVCLQAKDVVPPGEDAAPGRGGLDFESIARLHRRHAPAAPLIIQDTQEFDVPRVVDLLRGAWAAAGRDD